MLTRESFLPRTPVANDLDCTTRGLLETTLLADPSELTRTLEDSGGLIARWNRTLISVARGINEKSAPIS